MTNVDALLARLDALYNQWKPRMVTGSKGHLPTRYFDPARVDELTDRWSPMRDALKSLDPLADLPTRVIKVTPGTDCEGRGLVTAGQVRHILDDMKYALDVLRALPPPPAPSIDIKREGAFLAGKPFDAMLAVNGIIGTATKTLLLVDAYIGPRTLEILSARAAGVSVRILTHDKPNQTTTPALRTLAQAWNQQHGGSLAIRLSTAFHDRFIVIDDADYYHLGTSVKDAAVKGGFMFSRIEEAVIMTTLKDAFAKTWASAPVFV